MYAPTTEFGPGEEVVRHELPCTAHSYRAREAEIIEARVCALFNQPITNRFLSQLRATLDLLAVPVSF